MRLNGSQSEKLSEALRDAFKLKALERMLFFKLNRSLEDYAGGNDAQQVVFDLIDAANRQEWVDELILKAREAAPGNTKLFVFAQQFGLASTKAPQQELERITQEANSFIDPDAFRKKLGEMEPRICRIEILTNHGTVYGTGFLVAPSLVMTNYHVVEPLIPPGAGGITAMPANVTVRFDYKHMLDAAGNEVRVQLGRTCQLDQDWLVDASPNAPDGQAPQPGQLDYALIRLREAAGDDRLDAGADSGSGARRGFVPIPGAAPDFAADSSLFILQHPRGSPLKLAIDTRSVIGMYDAGLRVRYRTNTEPGSSGSPCFTPDWELAALHHSGDPDFDPAHKPAYNEGIPIVAIVALLTQRGHAGKLGRKQE